MSPPPCRHPVRLAVPPHQDEQRRGVHGHPGFDDGGPLPVGPAQDRGTPARPSAPRETSRLTVALQFVFPLAGIDENVRNTLDLLVVSRRSSAICAVLLVLTAPSPSLRSSSTTSSRSRMARARRGSGCRRRSGRPVGSRCVSASFTLLSPSLTVAPSSTTSSASCSGRSPSRTGSRVRPFPLSAPPQRASVC